MNQKHIGPSLTGDRLYTSPAGIVFLVLRQDCEWVTVQHHWEGWTWKVPTRDFLAYWKCG